MYNFQLFLLQIKQIQALGIPSRYTMNLILIKQLRKVRENEREKLIKLYKTKVILLQCKNKQKYNSKPNLDTKIYTKT